MQELLPLCVSVFFQTAQEFTVRVYSVIFRKYVVFVSLESRMALCSEYCHLDTRTPITPGASYLTQSKKNRAFFHRTIFSDCSSIGSAVLSVSGLLSRSMALYLHGTVYNIRAEFFTCRIPLRRTRYVL